MHYFFILTINMKSNNAIRIHLFQGSLQLCDQLADYQYRGAAMDDYNLLFFILDSYEDIKSATTSC
jgi:hypothetical protein